MRHHNLSLTNCHQTTPKVNRNPIVTRHFQTSRLKQIKAKVECQVRFRVKLAHLLHSLRAHDVAMIHLTSRRSSPPLLHTTYRQLVQAIKGSLFVFAQHVALIPGTGMLDAHQTFQVFQVRVHRTFRRQGLHRAWAPHAQTNGAGHGQLSRHQPTTWFVAAISALIVPFRQTVRPNDHTVGKPGVTVKRIGVSPKGRALAIGIGARHLPIE